MRSVSGLRIKSLTHVVSMMCLLGLAFSDAKGEVVYNLAYLPGSPMEAAVVDGSGASTVSGGARHVEAGGSWTYAFVVPPAARMTLTFTTQGEPEIEVLDAGSRKLQHATDRKGSQRLVRTTAPPNHPVGGSIRFTIRAVIEPVSVTDVTLTVRLSDGNGDGLSDFAERLMGLASGTHASVLPRPPLPHTSFQTGDTYSPRIGVPTDAILVYSDLAATYKTWADKGYTLQTMGGFRDGQEYVKDHPSEVQRDRTGSPIAIGGSSFYMVPTPERNQRSAEYYRRAVDAGSTAICPEEPEYFTNAGYEDPFKQEWQAKYGMPWQPPHSGVDARYRAEQLKQFFTRRQIETILNDSRYRSPSVTRMVAVHSPITYYLWGIPVPHYMLLTIPALQEIVGQVWTGTARSAAKANGIREERTFDVGYLEYSSLFHLTRGSGKRLWFLMDPVEDNPDRSMADYLSNYERTLVASLMFPSVTRFEVMPWPQRIYGRVPPAQATVVNTVVGALAEMWRYPEGTVEAGSDGIGTFVSDSMALQRGDPSASDFDGFFGLCLPLVLRGIPVQVLSLDRIGEPGYLEHTKTLLVSYNFLKPATAETNRALADWTTRGGSLVLFGGTDAYDTVADSWWRKAGLTSPLDDLFAQLGVQTRRPPSVSAGGSSPAVDYAMVLKGDGKVRDLSNRKPYTIDLTPFVHANGSVCVRFRDATPDDGWGPFLASAELRIAGTVAAAFKTGSDLETRFLSDDRDSRFNGDARFADGDSYWVYEFDNLPRDKQVTLTLDLGNGFIVDAAPAPPPAPSLESLDKNTDRRIAKLRLPGRFQVTRFIPPAAATGLYRLSDEAQPIAWQTKVGRGTLAFVGISPAYATSTAQTGLWLRDLVRRAVNTTGSTYKESEAFVAHRGPYLAVRTQWSDYSADGRYVDLLDSSLPIVEDPDIGPKRCALLLDARSARNLPRLLAASGRIGAQTETSDATAFLVRAPGETTGAARLWCGRRKLAGAKAFTVLGRPVDVHVQHDGQSVLLRYANDPDGVVVRAGWTAP